MKIIGAIKIIDIIEYEYIEHVNTLEELQNGSLFVVLDLIKIGNKCGDAEAESILNSALTSMNVEELFEEVAYELIGDKSDNEDECVEHSSFSSFSELLDTFYNQLQVVDDKLSISDFHNMSTKYMYKYAEGVHKRYIYSKNEQLRSQYENVAMFMSALAGKLKDCPQLNEDGSLHKASLKDKLAALRKG